MIPPAAHRLMLRVRGRVQGVGFDAAVRKRARALAVRGWVGNEPNGSVTVVAEGSRDDLDDRAGDGERSPEDGHAVELTLGGEHGAQALIDHPLLATVVDSLP